MTMDISIDEVVYFDVITSTPSTGAAADADSTPTFAVYEEATDSDIGVGGNMTKRTSLTGNYRGSFTASAANGFEAGKWYSVIVSATVATIAGKCRALMFRAVPAENVAGYPVVDTAKVSGTTQTAGDVPALINTVDSVADAILVDTAEIGAAGAGLTVLATAANLATVAGYLDTEILAIKAKTDLIPADPADASDIAALVDALPTAAENATAVLTTAMTEAYAADGVAPTLAQAIFLTMQRLTEFSISGTAITVKKLDGSTTAAVLTMNDASTPTSSTRSS